MGWIASLIVSLGRKIAPKLVIAYFTKERGEKHREWDRRQLWKFDVRSRSTPNKVDDAISTYFKARGNFHDSPDAKENKDIAKKAGLLKEENPSRFSGPHQP